MIILCDQIILLTNNMIQKGNMNEVANIDPKRNGWVIGSFIENSSIFHSDECEVKWAEHKKGYKKEGLRVDVTTKTVTILISGSFQVEFKDKQDGHHETALLKELGDYIAYDASKYDHIGEALDDSLVIVIRWPSKREDEN